MIQKLTCKGSPKEIGKQHGEQGKQQVLYSLKTYEELFHGYQFIDWKQARERALLHVDAIEKYDAELIEEMEGVAEGAGVDFEDILALNARSEIALGSYGGRGFSDGCTAIATFPPVSRDIIIGQNWDWKGQQQKSLLLMEIEQKSKPAVTIVTEGGIIGKIGFNSEGLGLCFNALLTDKKSNDVPIHLGLRAVLNSHTLPEAISKLKDGQIAATASFVIGKADKDGSGMAVNAEVSPFGIDLVGGTDGSFVHTNHIKSELLKENLTDMNEFIYDGSMMRYNRAKQLINIAKHEQENITEETYKEWLKDEFNAPEAINHFSNENTPEHRRMETVFSIIMNLSKRKTYLCIGKPSEGEYTEIE
ncbi:C45 family peptidase [Pseudogracilibacillus sp. SO30301A]|uniref:C45 family peptidase n=1 Tax=Pseudogracilibacillus sp. SO30301A TaxID=3098291 RepID=UPI00300DC35C